MANWEIGGDWVNSEVRSYLKYKGRRSNLVQRNRHKFA